MLRHRGEARLLPIKPLRGESADDVLGLTRLLNLLRRCFMLSSAAATTHGAAEPASTSRASI
jgi:hypothetical protein